MRLRLGPGAGAPRLGGATQGGRAGGTVRAAIVLGVPLGLTAGGLLSDRFGDAGAFEVVAAGAMAVALVTAWVLVPDLRVALRPRVPLKETMRAMSDPRLLADRQSELRALVFAAGGMVLTTLALLVHARRALPSSGATSKGRPGC